VLPSNPGVNDLASEAKWQELQNSLSVKQKIDPGYFSLATFICFPVMVISKKS